MFLNQHDLAPEMFHVKFQNRMHTLYKALLLAERLSYKTANIVINNE